MCGERLPVNLCRSIARRVAGDERGFTLVELLAVIALLSVMLAAILGVLAETQRVAPRDQERSSVIEATQAGMYRMTRELRHAYRVTAAGPWATTVSVMRNGVAAQLTYDCSGADPSRPAYRVCTRSESGGTAQPVISHVVLAPPAGGGSPPAVFTYRNNCAGRVNYISAAVVTAAAGDLKNGFKHTVILRDGFYLRNVDSCGPQQPAACP